MVMVEYDYDIALGREKLYKKTNRRLGFFFSQPFTLSFSCWLNGSRPGRAALRIKSFLQEQQQPAL